MNDPQPASDARGGLDDVAQARLRTIEQRARQHQQAFFELNADRLPAGETIAERSTRLSRLWQDPLRDPYDRAAAERWARQDVVDFRRLPAGHSRTDAALQLAENLAHSPRYADALRLLAPTLEREVRYIDQADRERMERDAVKQSIGGRVRPAPGPRRADDDLSATADRPRPLPVRERFDVQWGLAGRVYRFRDRTHAVALVEGWRELRAHQDTPAVAKAVVDRAIERGWRHLRIEGSDEFERQVRQVAAERGVAVVGMSRQHDVSRASGGAERGRSEPGHAYRKWPARAPSIDEPVLHALSMLLDRTPVAPQARLDALGSAKRKLQDCAYQGRQVVAPVFDTAAPAKTRVTAVDRTQPHEVERGR